MRGANFWSLRSNLPVWHSTKCVSVASTFNVWQCAPRQTVRHCGDSVVCGKILRQGGGGGTYVEETLIGGY